MTAEQSDKLCDLCRTLRYTLTGEQLVENGGICGDCRLKLLLPVSMHPDEITLLADIESRIMQALTVESDDRGSWIGGTDKAAKLVFDLLSLRYWTSHVDEDRADIATTKAGRGA